MDIGFEPKIKAIKTFADGSKKADWDVGMSLDAVTLANHVDTIVLCTGDGDFSRLCSHLRHEASAWKSWPSSPRRPRNSSRPPIRSSTSAIATRRSCSEGTAATDPRIGQWTPSHRVLEYGGRRCQRPITSAYAVTSRVAPVKR